MSQNRFTYHCYVCVFIQGLFQGVFTSIINTEGKYCLFVHFWHQTFIVLVLVIFILTLDMSVNNTSNSPVLHEHKQVLLYTFDKSLDLL